MIMFRYMSGVFSCLTSINVFITIACSGDSYSRLAVCLSLKQLLNTVRTIRGGYTAIPRWMEGYNYQNFNFLHNFQTVMLAAAQLLDYNGLFGLMTPIIKEPLGNRALHRVETFKKFNVILPDLKLKTTWV